MPFSSRHTSHSYEAEIQELRAALAKMGERCRGALRTAVTAVRTGSRELARQVVGLDRAVNDDEKAIDALTVRILALRQPVACDLRLLAMSFKLVTDLERIGDEAVNIAERAEDGPLVGNPETFADLDRMGEEAQQMVASALDAFLEGDDAGARAVLLRDDIVDELYGKTMRAMEEYMTTHPGEVRSALCVMSVAKYLERVADHATNVAEEVIFMVRGDDVRHAKSVGAFRGGGLKSPFDRAVAAIERRGVLLVYPLANRPEPRSLWSELHPRSPMRWAWDADADGRISRLWRLREELARSDEVVYAKWFRGRATFFARAVFRAILASLAREANLRAGLSRSACVLLELLEDNSPQSTKELRASAELQGRANEAQYARAMKELWSRLLVVGVGEVDDGAFPSLAMSATRLRFEPLWPGPRDESDDEAVASAASDARRLDATLVNAPLFARELAKTRAALRASKVP